MIGHLGGALRMVPEVVDEMAAVSNPAQVSSSPGDDEDESYCTVCGAACGIFQGHGDGWRHFRGDGTATAPVVLHDAGHVPVIGWRPAGDGG